MKKSLLLLGTVCLAVGAFASDIVLDIQLNGSELEDGHNATKVQERGVLVIEDIGAETNVHKGTLYLFDSKGNSKGKKKSYATEDAAVRIVSNNHSQFGMLVELENACFAGVGKASVDREGEFKQIIISSGHGIFLYTGFDMGSDETNAVPVDGVSSNIDEIVEVDDDVLEELEAGKMQAKLNKKLTDAAKDSSGTEAVELWLEEGIVPKKNDDKTTGKDKDKKKDDIDPAS